MIVASLGSLLPAIVLGLAVAAYTWRQDRLSLARLLFIGSLGVGLGFGLASCAYFVSLALVGPPTRFLAITELAVAVGLAIVLVYTRSHERRAATGSGQAAPAASPSPHPLLWICLGFAFVCVVTAFIALAWEFPHGQWDAWAIWNTRARYLFRAGEGWTVALSTGLAHTDNPLLIPGLIARSWTYIGGDTVFVPVLVAMLFTFATVGVLGSSVAIVRGKTQGVLAVLLLLGTPYLVEHGISQTADVPLGFFVLATVVLLSLQDYVVRSRSALAILAGMAAGFATWTKNEGWLFLASILVVRFAVVVWFRGWKAYLLELRSFALGLLPVLMIVVYFKLQFAPPNELVEAQSAERTIGRVRSFGRWYDVLRTFRDTIRDFGTNGWTYPLWLLSVYLACVGVQGAGKHTLAAGTGAAVFCLLLLGYAIVYVISPLNNLPAYVTNSLPRLLLQLWPTALFAYFLIASTPDEARG